MKADNDDHDARVEAIGRRAVELQTHISQPGRTEAEANAVLAEMAGLVAELRKLTEARTAQLHALQRQLGISTRPKLTVVKDDPG